MAFERAADPDPSPVSRTDQANSEAEAASASLVWGSIATVAWMLPPVGALVAMAGLIRGANGWRAPNRDRARLGVILSVGSLLLNAWWTAWIVVVMHYPSR